MKFYIGSGLQNAPQVRQLAQLLKDAGWEHTYDWTASLHTPLSLDTLRTMGEREFQGVKDADVVILLSPRGKGTHTEFGMALAWGKKVYLCHGDDSLFRGTRTPPPFTACPRCTAWWGTSKPSPARCWKAKNQHTQQKTGNSQRAAPGFRVFSFTAGGAPAKWCSPRW